MAVLRGGGPRYEHSLLGGLAIRFVWGLGEAVPRFLDPKKLCGIYRCLYTELGIKSVMGAATTSFPMPNSV